MKWQFKTMVAGIVMALLPCAQANALSWDSVLMFVKTMKDEASAWAITTKQTAVAAQQQSDSQLRSQSMLAAAIGAIEMADRVGRAVASVDPAVGQPRTLLCEAQTEGELRVEALDQRNRDAARLMQTFAGTRVSSQTVADNEALVVRHDRYCTIGEAKAGVCELVANGMQGWDSNYAGFASQVTLSPEAELAGYAYTAMLTDTRAPATIDCAGMSCDSAQATQMRVAAMSALAANSLVGQVVDRRVPILTGQ